MNLPALAAVGQQIQSSQQTYNAMSRWCDNTYASMFPGLASPSAAQQAQTIAAIAAYGTAAATVFAWHFANCQQVLAYEAAQGLTVSHAWNNNGTPSVPAGWTVSPVLDSNSNPTGALTLSYTAPSS